MKRSNLPIKNQSDRFPGAVPGRGPKAKTSRAYGPGILLLFLIFIANCGFSPTLRTNLEPSDQGDCLVLDSLLAEYGWRSPVRMAGRVTIDVKQYRVRGSFQLNTTGRGDLTFEFTSSSALGGHREDVVLSFHADTVRVLDRERLSFYEGAEVDSLVTGGVGLISDIADVLELVTTRVPECGRFGLVTASNSGPALELRGRFDGEDFGIDVVDGKVREAFWPVRFEGRLDDRLLVDYRWSRGPGGEDILEELVLFLEDRRWRVKLQAR